MNAHAQAAEAQLSRHELQDLKNKRLGLTIFQLSWIMAFVCLIMVNFWMRGAQATWPPPGVTVERLIPTLMTLTLIASSIFVRRGVRAIRQASLAGFGAAWRVTLLLGLVFALVMAVEFVNAPGSGQFQNIYRLMIGFHHVHALVILYYLWRVYQAGQRGAYTSVHYWPVEGGSGLWNFVTVAWVLFYIVLYWV